MKFYESKWLQTLFVLLYPVCVLGIKSLSTDTSLWLLIGVLLIFCGLWKNIKYLLFSNVLLVIAILVWWLFFARNTESGREMMAWYPIIIFNYLLFILLPEIIVVQGKNILMQYFARRRIDN